MNHTEEQKDIQAVSLVKVPSWERYDWLRHGFSTRQGGVSTVYGGHTLNLGWTKEDETASVTENRLRFTQAVTGNSEFTLVTIRQIHSSTTRIIHGATENLATADGKAILEGDGLMTDVPGILLAVGTADCIPVLVVDPIRKAVAAFHAGWRGTAARIVEKGIALMQQTYGSDPADLLATVGPGIGPCCYTVGEEVYASFTSNFAYGNQLFDHTKAPKTPTLNLDLWQANRNQLLAAGLAGERIAVAGECTACTRTAQGERRFFSHRDEQGHAGRMLNAIGIAQQ